MLSICRRRAHTESRGRQARQDFRRSVRRLAAQTQLRDQGAVALEVLLLEIGKKASAAADLEEKPTTAMVILFVDLEMLGEMVDRGGQRGDLHIGRTGVVARTSVLGEDLGLLFLRKRHEAKYTKAPTPVQEAWIEPRGPKSRSSHQDTRDRSMIVKIRRTAAVLATALSFAMGGIAQAEQVNVPRGTPIYVLTEERLSSKSSHDGDPVHLRLRDGFFHKNPAVLEGAVIDAHLTHVTAASPLHKATMSILFDDIKLNDGETLPIEARLSSVKSLEPRTHHLRDAGLIIGGAIVGHTMGSRHGMKHGGLAGAASGFALASAMKSDVVLNRNEQLTLRLTDALGH
jgi:hypothetical protein